MNLPLSRISYTLLILGFALHSLIGATPPSFSTQPQAEDDYAFGDSLELNVVAEGDPSPEIQWEKDGEIIEGETEARLFIKRLSPFDAGTYRALATNTEGNVYSS